VILDGEQGGQVEGFTGGDDRGEGGAAGELWNATEVFPRTGCA
jgi:hypothetical protein